MFVRIFSLKGRYIKPTTYDYLDDEKTHIDPSPDNGHSVGWTVLRECVSSWEDVSVNTIIILRNCGAILADLRSKAREEASIAPQF